MSAEIKGWLEKAHHDYKAAKKSFESGIYDWSCFQCQQAIEKALKYRYIHQHKELIKTHDLVFLGRKVDLPQHYLERCKELTVLYILARYPPDVELKDLKSKVLPFLDLTEKIYQRTELIVQIILSVVYTKGRNFVRKFQSFGIIQWVEKE